MLWNPEEDAEHRIFSLHADNAAAAAYGHNSTHIVNVKAIEVSKF